MRRFARGIVVAGALVVSAVASGHEGGAHTMGTVREIAPDRIVVTSRDGREVPFALAADTRFERGAKAVRPGDVKAGERVVVHARREGDRDVAEVVKLAPARRR